MITTNRNNMVLGLLGKNTSQYIKMSDCISSDLLARSSKAAATERGGKTTT